ncbi:MAG: AAA family ATPase [Acetobacteraceae bacterium]|nr:AAA family ATPase [Acetobacteraceae bacterium]
MAHRGWIEARDRVLSVVLAGRGLVLVLGAPGTGKTLLLQEIARTLRADGTDVLLLPRGDLVTNGAEAPTADLGVGRRRVVLIDEADRMNAAALDHLGRLGTCAFVLAGTRDPGDEQPGGWSPPVVRLAALPANEVGAFIAARLAQSQLRTDLLTEEAVAQLAEHSGGMPRMLNTLAGAALFLARTQRARRVEAVHVDQAAALRDGGDEAHAAASTVPGVIPCRPFEPLPSPAAVPSAARQAAVGPPATSARAQAPRRQGIVALGTAAVIAVACAGIAVAWHGDHARRTLLPLVAERQPAVSALPAVAAPHPNAFAAARAEAAASPPTLEAAPAVASRPLREAALQPSNLEALPSSAPAHVMVRYIRGRADAAAWAANLALMLRAAGFTVDAVVPVARSEARTGAHHFFAEDQVTADAVLKAAGLGGKGTLADARGLDAVLRPGLIELIVPPGQLQAGSRRQSSGDGQS